MPRIRHLLDHKARIWRRVEALGEWSEKDPAYTLADSAVPCASDGQSSVLANIGTGLRPSGDRWLYFDIPRRGPRPDIRHRDVIELYEGPTAPSWLEVESADPFRGHHWEVRASEFNGPRPEVAS